MSNHDIVTDLNEIIKPSHKHYIESEKEREEMYNKLYLGEIIEIEEPVFTSNNLILAPVGSGKSHLIEKQLIPKGSSGQILYLTSNTALKDSVCPNENKIRKFLAMQGRAVKFYTSGNTNRYGDEKYDVHVMTYHEFASRLEIPSQKRKFIDDIELIFCDEIHSLPTYENYGGNTNLILARTWLFDEHIDKQIFYFTATRHNLDLLEKRKPGTLDYITTFDYLAHPKIRRYLVNSTYFINHIEQIRPHLSSKLESFNYYGYKALAFTPRIKDQRRIAEIAIEEGFKPIILWSTNNGEEMSLEQLRVRTYILRSGNIPEPYNMLIINGAMQEGWDLFDRKMRLAILDTTDVTEQVQSLGRIRKDVDVVLCKTNDSLIREVIEVPSKYIDTPLTSEDKTSLYKRLNIVDENGNISKWPSLKKLLKKQGYLFEDKTISIDKKRVRVTIITVA